MGNFENSKDITSHLRFHRVINSEDAKALKPVILCKICKGAGYIRQDVLFGHPDFGKPKKCECRLAQEKVARQHSLFSLSGIVGLSRYEDATFETFKQLPGCRMAHRQALNFSINPDGWLVLLGPYGCGKTHLGAAIAKKRVEAGDTVLILTAPDLLDYLRSGYGKTEKAEPDYQKKFDMMCDVNLLILDDYGAQNDTAWAIEKLYQLLNHRYNRNLATVITSNNMDLAGIDPRVYSRLHDRDLVHIEKMDQASDYRLIHSGEKRT